MSRHHRKQKQISVISVDCGGSDSSSDSDHCCPKPKPKPKPKPEPKKATGFAATNSVVLDSSSPVFFDQVNWNSPSNSYNPGTGVFVTPRTGIYSISFLIHGERNNGGGIRYKAFLNINGQPKLCGLSPFSDSGDLKTADVTLTTTWLLNKGDALFISIENQQEILLINRFSLFSVNWVGQSC